MTLTSSDNTMPGLVRKWTVWVAVAAATFAVCMHALSQAGHTAENNASSSQVIAVDSNPVWPSAAAARFASLPQRGNTLGSNKAPVLIVTFADLQCTVCRQFSMNGEHAMIDHLIATGKARARLYPLAFIGPQSITAASWAFGAARQDKMWSFADAFFQNAGQENSGYASNTFLRGLSAVVPGLDTAQQETDASSPAATAFLGQSRALAKRLRVDGTPAVYVGTSMADLNPVSMKSVTDYTAIVRAVDAVTTGRSVSTHGHPVGQCSVKTNTCSVAPAR